MYVCMYVCIYIYIYIYICVCVCVCVYSSFIHSFIPSRRHSFITTPNVLLNAHLPFFSPKLPVFLLHSYPCFNPTVLVSLSRLLLNMI